jgi:hypothetical protein
MKKGIKLLSENIGEGDEVRRQHVYKIKLKCWLNKGQAVTWKGSWGLADRAVIEDNGKTLISDVRLNRESLIDGLFYGIEGMKIGGTRKLRISPHLAYGEKGIPDTIPSNAVLIFEVTIVKERSAVEQTAQL